MKTALNLVERGYVPKPLVRRGIRRLLGERLREQRELWSTDRAATMAGWVREMRSSTIAPVPQKANEQHYEVPPGFFELVLGPRLKYSSAYYDDAHTTLAEAEEAMLRKTSEHARLEDGQGVLELGCGWGSLTLWMAEQYPNSRILAVSNSAPQRRFVLDRAAARGLSNVEVLTQDMNLLDLTRRFDRVVSVEMFEHMRNWEELLCRVTRWCRPDARVFLHVFAHQRYAYPFEVRDESDWMSQHFFTGGMMPSTDLIERIESPFEVEQSAVIPGTHYARTSEDWLRNLERNRGQVRELFARTYGEGQANRWYHRWRVFFLSCAELFGYANGEEWVVSHVRLRRRGGDV